jgi:hypothetical protein
VHDKDGSFGGFRADLVCRDPTPIKSNIGERFVRLNNQCMELIDDFLIFQVRVPLRPILRCFKMRFCGSSDYELVINSKTPWEGSTFDIGIRR